MMARAMLPAPGGFLDAAGKSDYNQKTDDACARTGEKGKKEIMIRPMKCMLSLVLALMMMTSAAFAQEAPSLKDDFYEAVNAE